MNVKCCKFFAPIAIHVFVVTYYYEDMSILIKFDCMVSRDSLWANDLLMNHDNVTHHASLAIMVS